MNKNKNNNPEKGRNRRLSGGFPSSMVIMEMFGNREVNIEGINGVLEYDENIIRINTGSMIISFHGRGLKMECLTASSLVIKGFITKIEYLS